MGCSLGLRTLDRPLMDLMEIAGVEDVAFFFFFFFFLFPLSISDRDLFKQNESSSGDAILAKRAQTPAFPTRPP
jgi:hypothetical protein